jgi:hypothetical protein
MARCILLSLATIVVSLVMTSCNPTGHIVSTEMISKLSGSDIESNDKSEITVLRSGAIVYKDKKFMNKSTNNYNSSDLNFGNDFGPQDIKFGPN